MQKTLIAMIKKHRALITIIKLNGLALCLSLLTGCALEMYDQPRYEPLEKSAFFKDHQSARPRVADTVARNQSPDEYLTTGKFNDDFAPTFPFTVTLEVVQRGQERYNIFCAPCHGRLGDGKGIVVEYGLKEPPSFHTPDMIEETPGFYFDAITNGTRVMPSYAARIRPEDRWAIVAYIRALQLSQQADLSTVPPEKVPNLDNTGGVTK
ncbi:MAG: cytochrome c [Anaerolineae bacterium]